MNNWVYRRGDVYFANMEPHVGSEQGGIRPVVVLQNNLGNLYSPTLIVATATTRIAKKSHLPTHVLVENSLAFERPSIIQLEQLFTVDKSRIMRYTGRITPNEIGQVNQALLISLALHDATG
jgi:mRNA-degrading endonuclease toxin of MazEF toxin-antitoxin module